MAMVRTTRGAWTWLAVAGISCGGGGGNETGTGGASSSGGTTSDISTSVAPTSETPTSDPTPTTGGGGGTGTGTSATDTTADTTTDTTAALTTGPSTGEPGTGSDTTIAGGTTGPSCGVCDQPNQQCVDNECITSCQGQDPDPCGPAQVCDVISGECKDPADACVLAGPAEVCGAGTCGPGSVCDGVDTCLAISPCGSVLCTADGDCWGNECVCERVKDCVDPALDLLNGPFSKDIGGIDFADDCTAWMVTLRSGTDYLRRLTPAGEVSEWAGVANLNMGEVKVLRSLTIPQLTLPYPLADQPAPPVPKEGLGEVAITYTCCPACGCLVDPPQGVARLVEEDPQNPLPIVIVAQKTQGTGPFGSAAADAGPHGLTWGVDRVLYVGNSTSNGDFNSADLDAVTQEVEYKFADRVTAAAPVSPVHLVIGLIGGDVYRYNVLTKQADLLLDLGADITGFSHDNFTGQVYAGLATLEIVVFDPFTGEVASFDTMPGKGRVTVSPSGNLYYAPIRYLYAGPIQAYPLPDTF